MFWSKTWFLLVAMAGALAVAVALLAARPLQRDLERETGARLERAQHSASLLLKVNARKWIDTAAQVSTDAVLVEALEQATKGPADLGLVHKTVQERLRYFNDKMKVDLVWATDAHGRVIARAGLDEQVYKDGIEGFPLVADALRGLRGDDCWSLSGKLYRVAASPVIARDHYAGSLVVGQEVAGELAQSMKRVLDVDVAFLLRGRVLAASAQLPLLGQLPLLVDQHFEEMTANGRSAPVVVDQGGGDGSLVVLAPFVGEAEEHKAAYALVVPRQPVMTFGSLAGQLMALDPKTVPWLQLAPIGGGLLLALFIGFLLMRAEAIGPLNRLARESQALARGDVMRLDDDRHPGRFGTVARSVNTTLDRMGSAPRMSMTPPTREPAFTRQEPFARPEARPDPFGRTEPPRSDGRSEPFVASRPAAPPAPPFAPMASQRQNDSDPSSVPEFENSATVQRPRPVDGGLQRLDEADSSEIRRTEVRPSDLGRGPIVTAAASAATLQASAPGRNDTEPQEMGPDFIESPSEVLVSPLAHRAPPPPPPPRAMPAQTIMGVGAAGPSVNKDPFDDQTAVASPTEALLRAARETSQVRPVPNEEILETEFRQVYRDFIETKQACGESTEGITYDKFSGKLRSNRQQLISRYSCRTVKFQVYVKDGKAALKATPVTS
jgi:Double sensory domain of two-component sensor kinase